MKGTQHYAFGVRCRRDARRLDINRTLASNLDVPLQNRETASRGRIPAAWTEFAARGKRPNFFDQVSTKQLALPELATALGLGNVVGGPQ